MSECILKHCLEARLRVYERAGSLVDCPFLLQPLIQLSVFSGKGVHLVVSVTAEISTEKAAMQFLSDCLLTTLI